MNEIFTYTFCYYNYTKYRPESKHKPILQY